MKIAKLNSQNGFTLIESMIGLGIAMVVMLGVAQSFDLLARGKQNIAMGADATEMVHEIRQAMRSGQCQTMLSGKAFPGAVGAGTAIPSMAVGTKTMTVGAEIRPGLILRDVQLIRNGAGTSTTFNNGGTNISAINYVGVLRVQMEKPATSIGGGLMQPTFIPVRVTTNASNVVMDCSGVADLTESTCSDLNFVWDAAAGKCLYRLGQCQYAGSYVSENFNGWGASGGFQNPFTNGYSCPDDYEARLAGSYNRAESCGKGCVRNLLAPVYECVRCYDAAGTKIAPGATAAMTYVPEDIVAEDEVNEETNSVNTAISTAVSNLQTNWAASGDPCFAAGHTFSGSSCNTSGGGSSQNISASMCCSGTVRVCSNGFSFSFSGEPAVTYYIPNYMGCN